MMKAGVVGLGAMGGPIAENLHRAGLLSSVWNRSRGRAEAFAAHHATTIAGDVAGLAASCDVVVLSVAADADVLEVVDALLPALRAGMVIVDTSTIAAATARDAAARIAQSGAAYLDAPVSGGVEGARKGTLAMMVGGDADALDRARPVLGAFTAKIVHMGASGAGQATKAVNQIMAAGINQAVSEALAFGAAMGLDMERVIEVVGSGAVANWFLSHRGPTMVRGVFEPGFKVALHHKDLQICQAMAAGLGPDVRSALYRIKQELFEKQ